MTLEQLLFVEKLRLETVYDRRDSALVVKKLIEFDIFDQAVKIYEADGIGGLCHFIQYYHTKQLVEYIWGCQDEKL